jgi:hypothetical protein
VIGEPELDVCVCMAVAVERGGVGVMYMYGEGADEAVAAPGLETEGGRAVGQEGARECARDGWMG